MYVLSATDSYLSAEKVFVALSTNNVLRFPLTLAPYAVTGVTQVRPCKSEKILVSHYVRNIMTQIQIKLAIKCKYDSDLVYVNVSVHVAMAYPSFGCRFVTLICRCGDRFYFCRNPFIFSLVMSLYYKSQTCTEIFLVVEYVTRYLDSQ